MGSIVRQDVVGTFHFKFIAEENWKQARSSEKQQNVFRKNHTIGFACFFYRFSTCWRLAKTPPPPMPGTRLWSQLLVVLELVQRLLVWTARTSKSIKNDNILFVMWWSSLPIVFRWNTAVLLKCPSQLPAELMVGMECLHSNLMSWVWHSV